MTPTGKIEIEGEKVYKVVARLADGRLVSPYARGLDVSVGTEVEYIIGKITESPTGRGLYIYSTEGEAIRKADRTTSGMAYFKKTDDVRVHEAIALGKVDEDNCVPALVLGKEVWKPVLEPEEVWEDVTEECIVELEIVGQTSGACLLIRHSGAWLVEFYGDCPPRVNPSEINGKDYAFAAQDGIDGDWFTILQRVQ